LASRLPKSRLLIEPAAAETETRNLPRFAGRVLFMDDEEPIRNALKKFLNQQGYDVVTAGSGDEALRVLQRQKVSVVLLDVRMPGLDGLSVCRRLRRDAQSPVPVLMLTARATLDDKIAGFGEGGEHGTVERVALVGADHLGVVRLGVAEW